LLSTNEGLQSELATLKQQLDERNRSLESQKREARTDALTGLCNRRAFDEELSRRFAQWRRQHLPVSLLLVDVDHFKRFNDQHGHAVGDEVLRHVAGALSRAMRDMDIVARYGGEEFSVILPGTALHDAQRAAARACEAIQEAVLQHAGQEFRVTASVGAAQALPGDEIASLIARTDEALYAAKRAGRNRAYYHNGSASLPIGQQPTPATAPQDKQQQEAEVAKAIEMAVVAGLLEQGGPPADAPEPAGQEKRPERRRRSRSVYRAEQFIAPYDGHSLPSPRQFRQVECFDISPTGFSYIGSPEEKEQSLVVEFGVAPHLIYVTAEVVYRTPWPDAEGEQRRVGCRFIGRLQL
jgi:diguanylate cyclase (GGDEF)-like protein